jgi:hypothetical protein
MNMTVRTTLSARSETVMRFLVMLREWPNGKELSHSRMNQRLEMGAALNPKAGLLLAPAIC